MDVDLSTDLDALLPLVAPLVSGHSDVAIGSRLAPGSHVARHPKRELISRSYNLILRTALANTSARRAVRVQSGARLGGPPPPPRDRGRRLVLRHRALVARRAQTVCESTKCRSTGWTTPTAEFAWCRPRSVTFVVQPRMAVRFARGRGRIELGSDRRAPLVNDFGRRFVSFSLIGAASTAVSLVLYLSTHQAIGPIAGQRRRRHRDVRGQRVGKRALHRAPLPSALGPITRAVRGLDRGDERGPRVRRRVDDELVRADRGARPRHGHWPPARASSRSRNSR